MKKRILKTIRPIYEFIKTKPWMAHIPLSILENYNAFVSKKYLKNIFSKSFHENCDDQQILSSGYLDIISIAFNNSALIENQILFLEKNLTDHFFFTVADNSNKPEISKVIQNICKKKKIGYIRLPQNPWSQANLSHSVTLNWLYYNYIKPRKAEFFGFIDHDMFPIEKTSVINKFSADKEMYGHVQEKKGIHNTLWYLWAGFCFYRNEFLYNKKVNFSSTIITSFSDLIELDTGGGNWKNIYSQTNKDNVVIANTAIINNITHIDSWIHLEKASFKKNDQIEEFLNLINKQK